MTINAGLDVRDDLQASLHAHFRQAAEAVQAATRERYAGAAAGAAPDALALIEVVGDFLAVMSRLDGQYGVNAALPVDNAEAAADEALRALAELESWLIRFDLGPQIPHLQTLEIGVGYWSMRHGLTIGTAEPIVNALAAQSNAACSTQETAAVYALMQGFISHFSPTLKADLERSNPLRPWRLLNLNFAITAIRSGDVALMLYAFDTLNAHLPDERSGFYGEAHALASQPGFPDATRELIEAELVRWTRVH